MSRYVATDIAGFVRDKQTGAIINTNDDHYSVIVAQRKRALENKRVCEEMEKLKTELSDIKTMLAQLVNGKQNG